MIQRIQSVYLLLAGVLPAIGFAAASLSWETADARLASMDYHAVLLADGSAVSHPWGLLVFGILSVLIPLVAIFGYSNRRKQIRLARAGECVALLLYPTLYAYATAAGSRLTETMGATAATADMQLGWPVVLPLVAAVLSHMACRAIRKDDELIRSADRIR